jgi:hypothetical protein
MLEEDGELDRILSGRGLTFDNPPAPHVEPPKPVVIPPRTTLGDSAQSTIFPPGLSPPVATSARWTRRRQSLKLAVDVRYLAPFASRPERHSLDVNEEPTLFRVGWS